MTHIPNLFSKSVFYFFTFSLSQSNYSKDLYNGHTNKSIILIKDTLVRYPSVMAWFISASIYHSVYTHFSELWIESLGDKTALTVTYQNMPIVSPIQLRIGNFFTI